MRIADVSGAQRDGFDFPIRHLDLAAHFAHPFRDCLIARTLWLQRPRPGGG